MRESQAGDQKSLSPQPPPSLPALSFSRKPWQEGIAALGLRKQLTQRDSATPYPGPSSPPLLQIVKVGVIIMITTTLIE